MYMWLKLPGSISTNRKGGVLCQVEVAFSFLFLLATWAARDPTDLDEEFCIQKAAICVVLGLIQQPGTYVPTHSHNSSSMWEEPSLVCCPL